MHTSYAFFHYFLSLSLSLPFLFFFFLSRDWFKGRINKSKRNGSKEKGKGGEKHQGVFVSFYFFYLALWEVLKGKKKDLRSDTFELQPKVSYQNGTLSL